MEEIVPAILTSFASLFVILDPVFSVPVFTSLIRGATEREVRRQALIAVVVAGTLMYSFLFFNFVIFDILGITLPSFQVAGGILLFILGMQMALGIEFGHSQERTPSAAGVVIGTPLLCGPGAITTVILLAKEYGVFVPAVAIGLSLLATWLILRYSATIQRLFGECVTDIMAKVLGMLVASIAIKIIADGTRYLIGG